VTTATITAADLADLLGVTTRSISDLKKRGIVVAAGKDYALAPSVRGYCKHLRHLATGRGGEAAITTERRYSKAQAVEKTLTEEHSGPWHILPLEEAIRNSQQYIARLAKR
jgi:terminase small subunit / prophage DNA-packing protein